MSLHGARAQLLVALEAANIDAYYGWGAFSAPCARIFPGEPWVNLSGLAGGRRTQQWEVWAVAGKVDSNATFEEMEDLVQRINDAINDMSGWGHVQWRRPTITDMSGGRYLACRGVIETLMEV